MTCSGDVRSCKMNAKFYMALGPTEVAAGNAHRVVKPCCMNRQAAPASKYCPRCRCVSGESARRAKILNNDEMFKISHDATLDFGVDQQLFWRD